MSFLSISVMGPYQVTLDGQGVEGFEYNKVRALLAYLAVESDRPHHREVLAELFWPDRPAQTARNSLRQALSILRNVIGDREVEVPFLLITRDTVQFNRRSNHWLDAAVFVDSLNACREHLRRGNDLKNPCIHWLKQAARLYQGAFMDQFILNDCEQFEEWLRIRREDYRRQAMEVMAIITSFHEQKGEYEEAREFAYRQLELDPLRETAHRQIMRIFFLTGQRTAALSQYETCRRLLQQELGVEPEEETTSLFQRIKNAEEKSGPRGIEPTLDRPTVLISHPHNLPQEATPLIGRDRDVAHITGLLSSPACRLLTILGPGGIGKTRIALRVAAESIQDFPDGVYFVQLASLQIPDYLVTGIADALKYTLYGGGDAKSQILGYLKDKRILLVMDNFEHLLEAGDFLDEIIKKSPGLRVIATSRERLNLQEEWLFEPEGLRFPSEGESENLESYSSVQLFVRNAKRILPEFVLAEQDRIHVARICRLVEGFPLGIELAASWVRVLSCQEIASEIERNLDFLSTGARNVPDRHKSLRAVFEHSWNLLSQEERQVYERLSVFRGGFRREAAEVVVGTSLTVLSSLTNKSFLKRNVDGRYEMHEILRQFAESRLHETADRGSGIVSLHADYFARYLAERRTDLRGSRQKEGLQEIEEEIANIRDAWRYNISLMRTTEIWQCMEALWLYYDMRCWFQEGDESFSSAIAALRGSVSLPTSGSPGQRDRILEGALLARRGWFCLRRGDLQEAKRDIEDGIRLLQMSLNVRELAEPYRFLGVLALEEARSDEARTYLEKSLSCFIRVEDDAGMARVLMDLGRIELWNGEYAEARRVFQESNDMCRITGDRRGLSISLEGLGRVARAHGNAADASRLLNQSLEIREDLGDTWGMAYTMADLGDLAVDEENYEKALGLYEKSLQIFENVGDRSGVVSAMNRLGYVRFQQGLQGAAKRHFLQALRMAGMTGIASGREEALLGLALQHELEGDEERAAEIFVSMADGRQSGNIIRQKAVEVRQSLAGRRAELFDRGFHAGTRSVESLSELYLQGEVNEVEIEEE